MRKASLHTYRKTKSVYTHISFVYAQPPVEELALALADSVTKYFALPSPDNYINCYTISHDELTRMEPRQWLIQVATPFRRSVADWLTHLRWSRGMLQLIYRS